MHTDNEFRLSGLNLHARNGIETVNYCYFYYCWVKYVSSARFISLLGSKFQVSSQVVFNPFLSVLLDSFSVSLSLSHFQNEMLALSLMCCSMQRHYRFPVCEPNDYLKYYDWFVIHIDLKFKFRRLDNSYAYDVKFHRGMEYGSHGDGTDRYTSTSSTISGIYRSILPVCNPYAIDLTNYSRNYCPSPQNNSIHWHLSIQSPAPVCMFYFAHPFGGIATPTSSSYSIHGQDDGSTMGETPNTSSSKTKPFGWCDRMHFTIELEPQQQQEHVHEYIPWPQETWICDDVLLQPLIQALREQFGEWEPFRNLMRNLCMHGSKLQQFIGPPPSIPLQFSPFYLL